MRRDLVLDLPFFLSLSLSSRCFSIHKGCQVSATSQKSTTKPFNNPEQILGLKKEKPFFFPAVFFFSFLFFLCAFWCTDIIAPDPSFLFPALHHCHTVCTYTSPFFARSLFDFIQITLMRNVHNILWNRSLCDLDVCVNNVLYTLLYHKWTLKKYILDIKQDLGVFLTSWQPCNYPLLLLY